MYNKWLIRIFTLFLLFLHVGSLLAFVFYFSWVNFLLAILAWQVLSTIGISVCYHRQITHRSFSTNRVVKIFHLFCAMLSGQAGPVVWAHVHRIHHKYSDLDNDPHSPKEGFWSGHLGWIFNQEKRKDIEDFQNIPKDLLLDKDIQFFQKIHYPALIVLFVVLYQIGGASLMFWQGCFRITLTLHSAWIINSASHLWGYRNYETKDNSRNSKLLALFTAGEGFHNNHHARQSSPNLAHRKGEFDLGYLYIKILSKIGLAKVFHP